MNRSDRVIQRALTGLAALGFAAVAAIPQAFAAEWNGGPAAARQNIQDDLSYQEYLRGNGFRVESPTTPRSVERGGDKPAAPRRPTVKTS